MTYKSFIAWLLCLFRQSTAAKRYGAHLCPLCTSAVQWIPEAPGSVAGKYCLACDVVWSDDYPGRKGVRLLPYRIDGGQRP